MKQLTFLTTILCLFIASSTFAQVNKRSKVEYAMCKAKVAKMVDKKVNSYKSENGKKPSKALVQKWADQAMDYAGCEDLNPDAVTRSLNNQMNNKNEVDFGKYTEKERDYRLAKNYKHVMYLPAEKKIVVIDVKPGVKQVGLEYGEGVIASIPAGIYKKGLDSEELAEEERRYLARTIRKMRREEGENFDQIFYEMLQGIDNALEYEMMRELYNEREEVKLRPVSGKGEPVFFSEEGEELFDSID